ncbi:bifunctional ADP-dependent NAD(P)H-hydrate dehydratase/NAD(P)H-hydrate epimerase [Thioalkalivibrio sp. ALR17-21]|uniref:bifunctional ADP-dependent NAD(P)H-hydrate dehydratase/NAD(P)H-hydrate epimerase n=1 Tax=Thioalkalivibrio sp. ALR17-21 TaxID=1269813 RepID=UPI000418E428|nr:bifunctional ADP-dependent NAD(P)H-hydrate dehydratase/NAD(P)H-hydrate epimerase [Thioalkalivibrio sp. ALR17-21]
MNDAPAHPSPASPVPGERLFDTTRMRELDATAMALPGMAPGELMDRAGAALLEHLQECWPGVSRVGVLCGPGNNGGDGFVLARRARAAGLEVVLHAGSSRAREESDGKRARRLWEESGGEIHPLETFDPATADVWVDALFGIGLQRPLTDVYGEVIERLNRADRAVLAADAPSGVDTDNGALRGQAARATRTLTFIADKPGLHTGAAVDCAGTVSVATLDLPHSLAQSFAPAAWRIGPGHWRAGLPRRRPGAHKGDAGHVMIVGGAPGFAGAGRLAATAALRAGAGRVTLLTHPEHAAFVCNDRPEIMVRGVSEGPELLRWLERADAVAIGPGLDQGPWGRELWLAAADSGRPVVVDADALNLLAQTPRHSDDWVLTPHPGEAGRLLNLDAAAVEADRPGRLRELVVRFGGTVLLKGAGTLIADTDGGPYDCVTDGHPGMATPGCGDVLTGVIAALRGQGLDARGAARIGAGWHAAAGRVAARRLGGTVGMLAGDLIAALPAAAGGDDGF